MATNKFRATIRHTRIVERTLSATDEDDARRRLEREADPTVGRLKKVVSEEFRIMLIKPVD